MPPGRQDALRKYSRPSESTNARTGAYVPRALTLRSLCGFRYGRLFRFSRFFLPPAASFTVSLSNAIDVLFRLTIRRNAIPVFPDRPFARVVSSDRQARSFGNNDSRYFRYRTPPSIFSLMSKVFRTPNRRAVSGINCISPCAPFAETA